MSVKELVLKDDFKDLTVKETGDKIEVEIVGLDSFAFVWLDRNQAHLLMLYLQEHLK